MLANQLSIRELDAICREYEKDWQPYGSLADLQQFAGTRVQAGSDSYDDLLLELSLLDIEKRWRFRSDKLVAQAERSNGRGELDLASPPDFRAYQGLFAPDRCAPDMQSMLAQAELGARWAFGDIPDLESYQQLFSGIRRPDVPIPTVKLVSRGRVLAQLEVIGLVAIGRQSHGEPAAPAIHHGSPKKLVCAGMLETTTSRQQLQVEQICRGLIRVENGSRNRHLSLEDKDNLAPGERRFLKLNHAIQIPLKDSMIVLDRE
jgi:hypothetical protein